MAVQGWREKIAENLWEQLEPLLLITRPSEKSLAYSFVIEGNTLSDYWPEMPKHQIHLVQEDGKILGPLCGKKTRRHSELFARSHMISVCALQGHIPLVHSGGR